MEIPSLGVLLQCQGNFPTYNHVTGAVTLESKINKYITNVASQFRTDGYQTAMVYTRGLS